MGLSLSVVHTHFSESIPSNDGEVHITEDINECTICASHFKFSSESLSDSYPSEYSDSTFQQRSQLFSPEPLPGIHHERAPPVVIIG